MSILTTGLYVGVTAFEFYRDFWHQKTIESLGYGVALFA